MELEDSLTCSQEPATGTYPQARLVWSISSHNIYTINFIIFSHLHLKLFTSAPQTLSGLFYSGFSIDIHLCMYAILPWVVHVLPIPVFFICSPQ
jgi:hypothetical protein